MNGKLIVIEGTDCSGKETQTKILETKLMNAGYKVFKASFPVYDSPTGKIVGGPYLGKEHICKGWFEEGAVKVDPRVASLYYAADRFYNIDIIKEKIKSGYIVLLDRYITSNMAHQASKCSSSKEAIELIKWLEKLEYDLLALPKPDLTLFLHMPYEAAKPLRENRKESLDEHESSEDHLKKAEQIYLYLAREYNFTTVKCANDNVAKSIDEIAAYIYDVVSKQTENERRRI